jgi:hypothetical protein
MKPLRVNLGFVPGFKRSYPLPIPEENGVSALYVVTIAGTLWMRNADNATARHGQKETNLAIIPERGEGGVEPPLPLDGFEPSLKRPHVGARQPKALSQWPPDLSIVERLRRR